MIGLLVARGFFALISVFLFALSGLHDVADMGLVVTA